MTKPKPKKAKRNRKSQDTTLINNRARVKEIKELERRVRLLEKQMMVVEMLMRKL